MARGQLRVCGMRSHPAPYPVDHPRPLPTLPAAVETQLQELQHEMSLYKKLAHRHVVGFIHAEYDVKSSAFFIFLEYVPGAEGAGNT